MSDKQTVILVPVKPRTTDLSIKNDRVIFVPLATKDSFGIVKVGDGLLIDDGLLSFDYTDFEQAYLDKKLDKFQGIDNSGKILYVGLDGNISLRESEYMGISVKEDNSLISSNTLTLNFKDSFDVTSSGTETSISLKDIYVKKFNYSEFKEIEALNSDTWVLSDRTKEILIGDFDFTGSSLRKNNTIAINKIGIVATSSDPNSNAYSMIHCRSDEIRLGHVSDGGIFSGIHIKSDGAYIGADKILTEAYVSEDNLVYLNQDKLDFNTDKLIEDLNNYDSYTLANNNISLQHTGSDSGNGSTQFLLRRNDSELYLVSSEDSSGSKLGLYFNGFDVGVEYMNGNVNLLTDTVYWNGQPLALDGLDNVDTDMIVDGAITTSKISDGAVTDIKIDSVSGTKVSGVVRTTQQSLTDAEKQQAQKNITHTATQNHATSGVQVGWYQVANIKTNGNYNVKIKQAYNYYFPEAMQLAISINNRLFTGEPFASITQISGVKPGTFALSKIRVRQGTDGGTTFLDVYNPDQWWNTTWVDITSDSQDVVVEPNTPFQFIGTEDNPSGYKISSLDLVTGFNTNSLSVNNEEWQKIDFLTLDSGVGPISAVADRGRNYFRNSMVETSGVVISTSGWYRVAQLTDYMSGKVDICKQYNYGLSQVVSIDFGLAYRVDASSSYLKVTSTPKFAANQCVDKVRIAQYTDDSTSYSYLEVHINAASDNSYWSIFKDISAAYGPELTSNFQMLAFEPVSGTPIVTKVIDVKGETNVSNLNVNSTVTISGTVSDLNTISQPVNSTVTYSFGGGCANAPITDSGMVIQMQESTASCTQLVIANDDIASTWRRSYRNGSWTEWTKVGTFLPYEYNKAVPFGKSGYLYIGKFPIYDTNITVDISSTTSTTYSGKLVIACQNHVVLKASVFGDYSNTVTPNIYYKKVDNTVEVYFKPAAWSKNVIHITGCGIQGEVTHVCEKISAIPSDATLQPENEYVESGQTGAGQTELIYDMDSTDASINHGFTTGMTGTKYINHDFSQYHTIRIYARLYTSNCVQEIPVKNRKVAQSAMIVTGSNPIIISSLNILFTIEPLLNRLQVGAYGKYTFSSATGTFTLDSGSSDDNFYVYRIEGIV